MADEVVTTGGSRLRQLTKGWRVVSSVLPAVAVVLAIFKAFDLAPFGFMLLQKAYLYTLVSVLMSLCFLWMPATKTAPRDRVPMYDVVLFLVAFSFPLYYVYHSFEIASAWEIDAPPVAIGLGFILWLLVIEAARRVAGPVFAILVLLGSFYPLFAQYMPGILWAPTVSLQRLITFHALGDSLTGMAMQALGNIIVGFMFFAAVVQITGAGTFFTDLAQIAVRNSRASVAKVSIISSGLFGMVSGNSVADVFVTGSFTIPAMKREGFSAHFAGAVEAVASSGGVLVPPVMGSVAFVLAQFIGVSYMEVAIAAVVPAILYYLCLFASVDAYAARVDLKPSATMETTPTIWRIVITHAHIVASFLVLIVMIFVFRNTIQAPWLAAGTAIVLSSLRRETRITIRRLISLGDVLGQNVGDLVAVIGAVGLVVGSFVLTGLAFQFPRLLVGLAGGNTFLLLVLGAIAAFILGMGVPLLAVYLFLAIILVPALVQSGLDLMASHLYVMYWAIMSNITPPVAITAIAAASLAAAEPMKTALYAVRLGLSKFVLPFIFILNPALILNGSPMDIARTVVATGVGMALISGAFEGYCWRIGKLTWPSRVVLFTAALLLVDPGVTTDLWGAVLLVAFFGTCYVLRRQENPARRWLVIGY